MMQASLAVVGGVLGVVAYFSTLDLRWLLGAVVCSKFGPTQSVDHIGCGPYWI